MQIVPFQSGLWFSLVVSFRSLWWVAEPRFWVWPGWGFALLSVKTYEANHFAANRTVGMNPSLTRSLATWYSSNCCLDSLRNTPWLCRWSSLRAFIVSLPTV